MTSVTLPVIGLVVSIALAVLVLGLCVVAGYGLWQLRAAMPRRLRVLEDTLRVYNSVNATLGCRISELEQALQQARTPAAAPQQPEPAPPARAVQSAADRYESLAVATGQHSAPVAKMPITGPVPQQPIATARPAQRSEFTEAELRLAQLIKSRLSSLRVN